MPQDTLRKEAFQFDAGALGWIEGLTISSPPDNKPLAYYFGGVPYALPPIGPYRFRQARPLPPYYRYGTKASPGRFTGKSAVCPQPNPGGPLDETLWDEDCLQLNIHIPTGTAPRDGWPVYFFIHGGFLQWGSPNYFGPEYVAPLLSETAFEAIIVIPAHRLNALGFLASKELQSEAQLHGEPTGNQGFWDQRLALEWTFDNIGRFGGNQRNITVGGYSAGSHSAFHQLAHELYFVPKEKAIIKRVIMWSNSPGVQPKTLSEVQKQFDELLKTLGIPLSLTASEKLSRLRAVSPHDLISVQDTMTIHEFRALSDNHFISKRLIAHINDGDFARRMKSRGIKLMNGECRDEHSSYQTWRTPPSSFDAVYTRLCADYPERVVQTLMQLSCGDNKALPQGSKNWQDAFGRLYADMQVHCLERGFHNALVKGGLQPGKDLLRYRFNWRTKGTDGFFPPEWGVTHATDIAIWFWGLYFGDGLTDEEKKILQPWNAAFAAFVKAEQPKWGTSHVREMLRLREDGETDIWTDDQWEQGLKVWDAINGQEGGGVLGWIKSKM